MIRLQDRHKRIKEKVAKYGIPEAVRLENEETVKIVAMLKSIGYTAEFAHYYTEEETQNIMKEVSNRSRPLETQSL